MIGLDTNILVRYIARDDVIQTRRATQLIESLTAESPGHVSLVTVSELVWVMERCYDASRQEVSAVLETIFSIEQLHVESAEIAIQALHAFAASKADYADCLIERCCHHAGCDITITLDRKASKLSGMQLL